LETLSENGPAAVPFLKSALGHTETAYLACAAIERIGPPAAPTVPELTAMLGKTKHSKMLIQALLALASIGPAAAPAAPQIVPLLGHETDATVPVAAAYALGSIGARGADAELRRAAAGSDPFLQMMASWALAKLRPGDPIALKMAIDSKRGGPVPAVSQRTTGIGGTGAGRIVWRSRSGSSRTRCGCHCQLGRIGRAAPQ
jgi:HEAT repeat protein